jgi:hypothetical protein
MARTLVASDNFNRAALGTDWTNVGSSPIVIESSVTYRASHFSLYGIARWVGAGSFTTDNYSLAKIQTMTNEGAGHGAGVAVRISADVDPNFDCYYSLIDSDAVSGGTHTLVLGKLVNGADTVLTSTTATATSGDIIEIECEGTALRLFQNGAQKLSTTDSALASGVPGIFSRTNITSYVGDDWEGGNFTGAGPVIAWVRA